MILVQRARGGETVVSTSGWGGGGSSRSGSSSSSSSSVPDVELCAWLFFLRLELQERAMLRLIVLVFLLYWLRVQVLRSEVLSVRGGRVLAPFG